MHNDHILFEHIVENKTETGMFAVQVCEGDEPEKGVDNFILYVGVTINQTPHKDRLLFTTNQRTRKAITTLSELANAFEDGATFNKAVPCSQLELIADQDEPAILATSLTIDSVEHGSQEAFTYFEAEDVRNALSGATQTLLEQVGDDYPDEQTKLKEILTTIASTELAIED